MAARSKRDFYVGGDKFVYYSPDQARGIARKRRRSLNEMAQTELQTTRRSFGRSVSSGNSCYFSQFL
jgi:hypothetical protein